MSNSSSTSAGSPIGIRPAIALRSPADLPQFEIPCRAHRATDSCAIAREVGVLTKSALDFDAATGENTSLVSGG
jgi:hypothetical protein